MKNFIYLLSIFFLASCDQDNKREKSISSNYELEITDSIRVDYLQQLAMVDMENGKYLAKSEDLSTFVIFDDDGEIINQIELKTDGPNAIQRTVGEGFFEGEFTVMDNQKGLLQFSNESEIIKTQPLPGDYFFTHIYNRPVFSLGKNLAYYRPERDFSDWENPELYYKRNYNSPILEVLDPKTNETTLKMKIPETSVYKDGEFHYILDPKIIKKGKTWYLTLMAEMKFNVYEEKGDELIFKESINFNPKDHIKFPSVSIKSPIEIYNKLETIVPAMILQLYGFENKTVLLYRKGVGENIVQQYDRNNESEWLDFIGSLPIYAAIFDTNHELIQEDIALPYGSITTPVFTEDEQIVVQKNQRLSGEEDWNTYYKLKLTEKK
ncbi:hypothetical protein MM213_03675 [Belliella sp. R4-6]|uniref:6-bladed beta-propeller protein n=1 Tax=Belliella alkalica TaxID=1730871 RepID=A0ABS9V886_9BACT|nr:hypothetical protein [Belliella alkalica]MCH7412573.1 hypothetical protein [Belliella alkalica]